MYLQCIFTALAASKPEDPNKFIVEKLREYQQGKQFDLPWDAFIAHKDLPAKRIFKKTFIENFFTLEDLAELVSHLIGIKHFELLDFGFILVLLYSRYILIKSCFAYYK